ncbi:MAG: HEAT repeat domain-containing protein, partial [Promethearchaeota archaeon]
MDDLETIIKELLHTKDPESLIKKLIAEEEDLFQKVIANLRYSGKARGVEAGDSRVVDLLLELLTNEDSKVRRAVIAALGA